MITKILRILVVIFYPACTPHGRQDRIKELMRRTGEMRDVCAAVVYARDAKRVGFTFTDDEKVEAIRLISLLEHGGMRVPADRGE